MGGYISLQDVYPEVYSTYYYAIHSFQLGFRHDSIMNWHHDIDWKIIRKQIQDLINKGNKHENRDQIKYRYKQGDQVLLKNVRETKFNQNANLDPCVITAVRNNGTVRDRKGKVKDTFNIQNLIPYKE